MSFISPLWLLCLLPWMAVVVWLLTGQRERMAVPFLELWRGGDAPLPKAKPAMHVPPVAVLLVLGAALLAILAAARPRVGIGAEAARKIVILVGQDVTAHSDRPWGAALADVRTAIADHFGSGEPVLTGADGPAVSVALRLLADPDVVVFAVTDEPITIDDPRLIHVPPGASVPNAGIAAAGASNSPRPQVMVRVRNDSPQTSGMLSVGSVSKSIDLPAAGTEKNYFIDVDRLEGKTAIKLAVDEEYGGDNQVELTRAATWPRIDPEPGLGPEVHRMVEAYGKLRPPERSSTRILITTGPTRRPAIILARADRLIGASPISIEDHPITANVDWPGIAREAIRIAPPPEADWRILARAGGEPILAVREAPVRQAWVGFGSDSLPRRSDFVILWTNLLDWVGQADERFVATGRFARPPVAPAASDWESRLDRVPPRLKAGREISPILAGLALLMIFTAALLWGVAKKAR